MNIFNEFCRRLFFIPPKYPQTIQVGITNVCNFNCPMCQRFDLKVDIKHIDFELYKKIIEKINSKYCKNIILTGWGEPLSHPQFIDLVKLARQKGLQVRFTTNGSLLTQALAEQLLDLDVKAITFSIDEVESDSNSIGHEIKNQFNNIKYLISLKEKLIKKTEIYFQTTYPKNNEEKILKLIDYADQIGVDRVKISRLDIRFQNLVRPSREQEVNFIKLIENKIKDKNITVDFLPYLAFDGLARKIYKIIYPYLHQKGKYCLRTFSDLYINVNGQATPCCALPKFEIGDLNEKSIEEIWHSCKIKNFRKYQKNICGACDVLEINYKG